MVRPRAFRKTEFNPKVVYFKPQGVPLRSLQVVNLSLEEMEAYRLRHQDDLDQKEAAAKMETSASTYQRILYSAYKKIALALIEGRAIRINKK